MHTGDGSIVQQCLSGNTDAFALLVDKYQARIFALVYAKVGQFQDAEDITQEVFLNAYAKLSTLRRWDNFYPWIYSIAANRCKNFHRDKKRKIDTVPLADLAEHHQVDISTHSESEKLKIEQLHAALASLPEIYRQVLVLRYMAGMKSKEIAQTLRVSPNTINQRLRRAREKLKTALNEEMIPMMPNAFADRKLQPGFTSRVVELIKETKIQTPPHKTPLPLGLSAVGGVIVLLLSLSLPQNPLYPIGEWIGSPLPLKTQVVENGEMAVDAEVTQVTLLADTQADGEFGQKPKPLQTPAAIGEGEETDEKKTAITGIHFPDDASWSVDISPDGTKMVYPGSGLTPSGYKFQLIVLPLVDTSTGMSPEPTVLVQEEEATKYLQPKWSPDGKWVAFYRHEYPTGAENRGKDIDVYLIPAAGGEMRFLAKTDSQKRPRGLSWSPDNKELAFVKWNGKKADIYIVSLDTGAVRPFTTDEKMNSQPSWSLDGKSIFYSSPRDNQSRVWRKPIDGGKAVLTNTVDIEHPFIYSPDGRWVAYGNLIRTNIVHTHLVRGFLYRDEDRTGSIALDRVNEQGELAGEPTLFKSAHLKKWAKPLRWTPDRKIIVLQDGATESTYVTLTIKNGEQHSFSRNARFPLELESMQWLSDGKRLFLSSRSVIETSHSQFSLKAESEHVWQRLTTSQSRFLDIETSQLTELSIELPEGMRLDKSTLSPDETQVAFVGQDFPEARAHIYIMPVTGGTAKQLTHGELYVTDLRWSPDGQKIAFISWKMRISGDPKSKLCVVSVSDGQVKTLEDTGLSMEPAWSPDGTMLAYRRSPFDDLYIVPATGGESKQITSLKEQETAIHWTPDGKRVTFKINGVAWRVVSIDGGEPKKLHRNYIPLSWSSDGRSYLAFGPHHGLQRVSLDGATTPILTLERRVQVRVPTAAVPLLMSPDGETILFHQTKQGKQCWRIDVSHLVGQ